MTETTSTSTPSPARPGIPWLLILGLSSLALLWPLAHLLGILGGGAGAWLLVAVIAATWIGVVGFARVPRPVLVLALAGVGHGAISMVVATMTGGSDAPWWAHFAALPFDAAYGALAGLLALGLQRILASASARRGAGPADATTVRSSADGAAGRTGERA